MTSQATSTASPPPKTGPRTLITTRTYIRSGGKGTRQRKSCPLSHSLIPRAGRSAAKIRELRARCAPSSGKVTRHRLDRGGDRQANSARLAALITRMSCDSQPKAHCRLALFWAADVEEEPRVRDRGTRAPPICRQGPEGRDASGERVLPCGHMPMTLVYGPLPEPLPTPQQLCSARGDRVSLIRSSLRGLPAPPRTDLIGPEGSLRQ